MTATASDSNFNDEGDWVDAGDCGPGQPARSSSWHGTHVAGTVAANSDNGIGVAGVNWQAKLLGVRVLGRCGGTISDIADGVRWAAGLPVPGIPNNTKPAKVINMSLGGTSTSCSTTYSKTFEDVTAAGATVVVSAGNDNHNASQNEPANCPYVITVAANHITGGKADYSNYGAKVDITAPGGQGEAPYTVLSTLNGSTTVPYADQYNYAWNQGTSMAAPHVSGVASLILGIKPFLTPDQVETILKVSARPFPQGSDCNTNICGAGLLDAYQALLKAQTYQPPTPTATSSPTPTNTFVPTATSTPTATATQFFTPTSTATPATGTMCSLYTSSDVPKVIPDNEATSISSVLSVPAAGKITDVNVVSLKGKHTWVQDLRFNLKSPQGTEVQVLSLATCGDFSQNFDLNLDDSAATNAPCPPVGGGTYKPSNPLSAFNGQEQLGTWTLRVEDVFHEDGGSLDSWGLSSVKTIPSPRQQPRQPPRLTRRLPTHLHQRRPKCRPLPRRKPLKNRIRQFSLQPCPILHSPESRSRCLPD